MLSISFWHVSGGISVHSLATLSHNSCTPLGGVSYCWSLALRCCQRCSMGFKSGDWGGHFMGMMLLSENHCSAFFEVCVCVIVLLEVPPILSHLQTFNALLHSLLQNLTILHWIYLPPHLYQHPHPIPAHTSPNHQVIPPSMLDSWCGGPVWYWFPLLLPNIHFPIWPNPIDFCLISPQHLLPVLHSPISMVLGKF